MIKMSVNNTDLRKDYMTHGILFRPKNRIIKVFILNTYHDI